VATDSSGARIGEFAYAVLQDPKDFALVRLDPGAAANPEMCHFGGPTSTNDSNPGPVPQTPLNHFGNGVAIGSALPARTAVALACPIPTTCSPTAWPCPAIPAAASSPAMEGLWASSSRSAGTRGRRHRRRGRRAGGNHEDHPAGQSRRAGPGHGSDSADGTAFLAAGRAPPTASDTRIRIYSPGRQRPGQSAGAGRLSVSPNPHQDSNCKAQS
jgi:hypothetical protein